MARRYDRVGAAFRAVYDRAVSRAPRPPTFGDLQAQAAMAPASRQLLERPLAALLVAGLVVVVVGAAAFILTGEPGEEPAVASTVPVETTAGNDDQPAPTTATTTISPTTTEGPLLLRSAPWSSEPLSASEVDEVLRMVWTQADNNLWCSLLAPASTGPEGEDATTRAANFGSDSWAVAWDLLDGPGMQGDSSQCGNCGRSAFGIAGVGLVPSGHDFSQRQHVISWADGSTAGYGPGQPASEDEPALGHRYSGEIAVVGQACLYQVWSNLGEDHLQFLLAQLRFVEGHQADPIEVRAPGDPPAVLIDAGDAPWEQSPLAANAVPSLLVTAWRDSKAATPLVAIEGVAEELPDARIRTANFGAWGVAWNNPDGPGHDSSNNPCNNCGRGVIGLSGVSASAVSEYTGPARYGRVEWNDGSFASYDLYLGSQGLPPDLVVYTDAATGEEVPDGWLAQVEIVGTDSTYSVWSHLGEDHLIDLLTRLRFVEVAP